MSLIGMTEAATRAAMTVDGVRTALLNAGAPLVRISARALAVEERDLEQMLKSRPADYQGRGRPKGSKNKSKVGSGGD